MPKRIPRSLLNAQRVHAEFLNRMGIGDIKIDRRHMPSFFPEPFVPDPRVPKTSDCVPRGVGTKKDLLYRHKWQKGAEESDATVAAMLEKAQSVSIPYNKGPAMFVMKSDISSLGKK
jgi:hypothetical protein